MPDSQGYLMPEPSWDLRIYVSDLQVERTLRVKGDMHIGGIMLRLVEDLDVSVDWSDHAIWWPKKNCWLTKTRLTLNQHGVQGDSVLHFTLMHKPLRVQLPDLRFIEAKVDFSATCFTACRQLCKELGIRCGEELSFCRPLNHEHLRANNQVISVTHGQRPFGTNNNNIYSNTNSMRQNNVNSTLISDNKPNNYMTRGGTLDTRSQSPDITSTLSRHASYKGFTATYNSAMLAEDLKNLEISNSPHSPSSDAKASLLYPKTLVERARMNASWLNSSLSLYEQNVREYDTLQLKFKYLEFYDLNPKLDMARINQIYEQAKWSILTEEIECSEDEMMMFGALQYQIQQQASNPIPDDLDKTNDDIDAALNDLQAQLEGGTTVYDKNFYNNHQANNQSIPTNTPPTYVPGAIVDSQSVNRNMQSDIVNLTTELSDFIRFMKLKKFTLKTFKKLFFVFRDTTLTAYRNKDDKIREEPAFAIDLRGCDVVPDVNLMHGKFGVKLSTPGLDSMSDYLLRFDTQHQYCQWIAAFKLASRGKPISDPSYEEEIRTTVDLINLQYPQTAMVMSPSNDNIRVDEYIAPRHSRNRNRVGRSAATRILEAHSNVKYLSSTYCKLNYIKAWRALPDFGIHMFVVRFGGSNKEEILGIASDRLIRIDPSSGDHLRVWRFATMKSWHVNWEIKQMIVEFEESDVTFSVLSADCKIPHEFIGGYTYLSMRSKGNNQSLNEELFQKLTGGWI